MKEKANTSVRFALSMIKTDQFAILGEVVKNEEISLGVGLQFGVNKDSETISVKFSTQFIQQSKPLILIEASCFFLIEPEGWKSLFDKNILIVPKTLATHLAVITVGTVRGILHARTEGTNYNGFVLPTINVTELVTEDLNL